MKITYKKLETEDEIRGKAYVHWKAWHEAYADIVDPQYLQKLTLEKCESIAMTWRENNVIALDGGRVIGFAADGCEKVATLGSPVRVVRMVLKLQRS